MTPIEWSAQYETGDPVIDEQHRNLVEIVNKFEAASRKGKARRILDEILRDLVGYTQEHFTAEEAIMAEAGYDKLKLHKAQHRQLLQKVERFQFEFRSGKRVSAKMHDFLQYWLMNHIRIDDMAFAAARGTAAAAGDAPVEESVPSS